MSALRKGLIQLGYTTTHSFRYPSILLSTRYHHCNDSTSTDPRTKDYFSDYQHNQKSLQYQSSTDFDPTDTRKVFSSISTFQLIKYNLMISMLSIPPLTNTMTKIMVNAVGTGTPQTKQDENTQTKQDENTQTPITISNIRQNKLTISDIPGMPALYAILGIIGNILSKPLVYIVRKQYFPLFTGGETIEDCISVAKKYYDNNINLIIDNSVEEGDSPEVYSHNLLSKKELVDVSCDKLSKSVAFMAIKMTALSSPKLLEDMTYILNINAPINRDPTPYMTDEQLNELDITINTLTDICQYAKDRNIGVWLDAEQYSRQNGMNYLSRRLMQIINKNNEKKIYLYNTYQCYLQESHDWIAFDIEHAKENEYQCGIKLVRGAYMDHESEMAMNEKRPNPIHKAKSDTDESYDRAVNYVMEQIVKYYGNVGIAICTHNRESLQNATEQMKRLGIERDDPYVYTAQLNGMVDNLTYSLGYSGYNALKLIPYGSFEDVWPFLLRRFEENSQILNGSQQEKGLYTYEIKRRIGLSS